MKKKSISLSPKLMLGKDTIIALNNSQLDAIAGGATFTDPGCVGTNHCTVLNACGPVTKGEECQQQTKGCAA